MNSSLRISGEGLGLIKGFESFVAWPYDDALPMRGGAYREWKGGPVIGTLTIGYGHTDAAGRPHVKAGMRLTEDEALDILHTDLAPVQHDVWRFIRVPLAQHEVDALCSFHFNTGGLMGSTLRRKLIVGDRAGAADEFLRWTKAQGKVSRGLVRRRKAERAMFLGEDWRALLP
jgi:lysozyme